MMLGQASSAAFKVAASRTSSPVKPSSTATMASNGTFDQSESPAYVLPSAAYKSASVVNDDSNADMLLDSRNIAWSDAPSIGAVPYPVPTGPPSVSWQRNDFSRGLYNTNTIATSKQFGQELSGPSLNTTN